MYATASRPASERSASRWRWADSLFTGGWSPGVSTNTTWASGVVRMQRMRLRVVWGRGETMTTFRPRMALMNVDFPTFVRPTTATVPVL